MNEPVWKLYVRPSQTVADAVWREWPDGKQESCLVTALEYIAWLEAGNTPIPAEENT
jgi:hypothetical protein